MTFQFHALNDADFSHLFALDEAELETHGAIKTIVTEYPGAPCRVSLEDAPIGETVILVNYEHMAKASPYRASHAVYVRPNVKTAVLQPGEVPALLRHRLVSIRAFDNSGMMRDADVVEGTKVEVVLEQFLANPAVEEIHVHYAKPGCFAARVTRA